MCPLSLPASLSQIIMSFGLCVQSLYLFSLGCYARMGLKREREFLENTWGIPRYTWGIF